MSIWDAFGKGRYKGFSREAGQLLDKAVELAGGLGCKKADTGHLLWAMLQADGGPAARFLAGKNISELEVRRQLSAGRDGSVTRLARGDMAADLRRAMDYAIIGAQHAVRVVQARQRVGLVVFGVNGQDYADGFQRLAVTLELGKDLPLRHLGSDGKAVHTIVPHDAAPERIVQVEHKRLFVAAVQRLDDIGHTVGQ